MRMGVWATRNQINMQDAYRAGYDSDHPLRPAMLEDFRKTVLSLWPLEDLTGLGVAPTSYLDDQHAFAFLPFGVAEDGGRLGHGRLMSGLIIPMLLEENEWRVDLPGWRFYQPPRQG